MAKRDSFILKSFAMFLRDHIKGFSEYSLEMQFHFAHLAFALNEKRFQHNKYEDYAFLPYQSIYSKFGRKFLTINEQLGFFDITPDWSKKEKRTRGIRLTKHIEVLKNYYLKSDPILSDLICETGKTLRKIPKNGIMTEVNVTNRKNTAIKTTVPVNHECASRLLERLISIKNEIGIDVNYLLNSIRTLKHYSYTKLAGKNMLIQRYSYSDAGRLYAKGVSLQNAPGIVRDAFLSGCWNHDFDNCHYSIFSQLAERVGIQCTAIQYYLTHKIAVRQTIAVQVGITIAQVKVVLLALMYGARETLWHESAIPQLIGDKTADLYRHSLFSQFSEEIRQGRSEIIKQWPDTSQRSIINAMDKSISKNEDARFVMAHIQQGLEARMLHIAIDYYGDDILLLQHDGFSTTHKIDTFIITQQIQFDLNIVMTMTSKTHQIQLNEVDERVKFISPKSNRISHPIKDKITSREQGIMQGQY